MAWEVHEVESAELAAELTAGPGAALGIDRMAWSCTRTTAGR